MKNLLTTEREKAREEFRKKWGRFYYSDTVGMDWEKPAERHFTPNATAEIEGSDGKCLASGDMEKDMDSLVSNVIKATLDSVREGMPEEKAPHELPNGELVHWYWNDYRTAFLNHLKELEKGV